MTVAEGLFSVLLGSVTPVPQVLFDGSPRYLTQKIGSDDEMTPRQRLASVGYAYRANTSDDAGGGSGGDNLGNHIATKNIQLNGHKITDDDDRGIFFGNNFLEKIFSIEYDTEINRDLYIKGYLKVAEGFKLGSDINANGFLDVAERATIGSHIKSSNGHITTGAPSSGYGIGDICATDDLIADDALSVGGNATIGGNITKYGTVSDVMQTRSYGTRKHYADESTEVYHFDRGQGRLQNGETVIQLDPVYLETVTINSQHPLLVQLTPTADCRGLYVAEQTGTSFTVRELQGGVSNATFNWEAGAKRTGYEDVRLEQALSESHAE